MKRHGTAAPQFQLKMGLTPKEKGSRIRNSSNHEVAMVRGGS